MPELFDLWARAQLVGAFSIGLVFLALLVIDVVAGDG